MRAGSGLASGAGTEKGLLFEQAEDGLRGGVGLRQSGNAIQDYSTGVGLAYQARWDEAIALFDSAVQAAPTYANAYAQRAGAYAAKGDYEAAVRDYEAARAKGDTSANTAGELAWAYYLLGRFSDATAMNQIGLKATPDELWLRFDLGLSLLAERFGLHGGEIQHFIRGRDPDLGTYRA